MSDEEKWSKVFTALEEASKERNNIILTQERTNAALNQHVALCSQTHVEISRQMDSRDGQIAELDRILDGNGRPGLKGTVQDVLREQEQQKKLLSRVLAGSWAVGVLIFGSVLTQVIVLWVKLGGKP